MKKIIRTTLVAGMLALGLTACGSITGETDNDSNGNNGSSVQNQEDHDFGNGAMHNVRSGTFEQTLPNGDTVLCVWSHGYEAGGPSCDWVGYHQQHPNTNPADTSSAKKTDKTTK